MLEDFFARAFIAVLGLALLTGPLGCFLIWKRMAFFGDTLGHASLLGVGFGLLLNIDPHIGVILTCITIASLFAWTLNRREETSDTWLAIFSYGSLALGVVVLSYGNYVIDPESLLFGNILALYDHDLAWIWLTALVANGLLLFFWRSVLMVTIDEDLARSAGIKASQIQACMILLLAAIIAVALKVVGALLVPALLIIPAASASPLSRTPEQMAIYATFFALGSSVLGLCASLFIDIPTGPAIVITAIIFLLCVKSYRSLSLTP